MTHLTALLALPAMVAVITPQAIQPRVQLQATGGHHKITWNSSYAQSVWIEGLPGCYGQPDGCTPLSGRMFKVPAGTYVVYALGGYGEIRSVPVVVQ